MSKKSFDEPAHMLRGEPFSALDPLIRRDMQGELLNLQQTQHMTVIFITHDFLEAIKLGDRVTIMESTIKWGLPQGIKKRIWDLPAVASAGIRAS